MAVIGLDVETYRNLFYVGLKRFSDGVRLGFELSHRSKPDFARLRKIVLNNTIVTYNGMSYDMPIVFLALAGAPNRELKLASDFIIKNNIKYWETENVLRNMFPEFSLSMPRIDHIDLIEPQPNASASLKTLHGRLHGRRMQDLPYAVDTKLTEQQMDDVIHYNDNDLDATRGLWDALAEPMKLRIDIGKRIGQDLRSKSDTQVGAAIMKARVEKVTGNKIGKPDIHFGATFRYKPPAYIKFETPQLQEILAKLVEHQFTVNAKGKADLPQFLEEAKVDLAGMTYQMGIGGLHSTEANRTVYSDDDCVLVDADVASYYPAIIRTLGLFPATVGPIFLKVYGDIIDERLEAKAKGDKSTADSLKITGNGMFGLTSNLYSFAYSPQMTIAITLTGQLGQLLLIERAAKAGLRVVSANTDGVTFLVPRAFYEGMIKDKDGNDTIRLAPSLLADLTAQWERDTGFNLEFVEYRSLHNASVNSYFAVKKDGKVKRKGVYADQLDPKDMRTTLMKSPAMQICADAVADYLAKGVSIERTILESRDIRRFVTVREVRGGGIWRDQYLGKVVRYIWSIDGDLVSYKLSGNKVPKSDGARELMELPDEWPDDLDYDHYIREAHDILVDVGARRPMPVVKKIPVRSVGKARGVLLASLFG